MGDRMLPLSTRERGGVRVKITVCVAVELVHLPGREMRAPADIVLEVAGLPSVGDLPEVWIVEARASLVGAYTLWRDCVIQ